MHTLKYASSFFQNITHEKKSKWSYVRPLTFVKRVEMKDMTGKKDKSQNFYKSKACPIRFNTY